MLLLRLLLLIRNALNNVNYLVVSSRKVQYLHTMTVDGQAEYVWYSVHCPPWCT